MGPRLLSRGKPKGECPKFSTSPLQWGRDFSAAESRASDGRTDSAFGASMGPRLLSRGKLESQTEGMRQYAASMGPRLLSRGKLCQSDQPIDRAHGLQWGRDFSAAESLDDKPTCRCSACFNGAATSQPRKAATVRLGLWNEYSFNGAATSQPRKESTSPRVATCRQCFNGAATSQPRKACVVCSSKPSRSTLQWGRDFSAAERSRCWTWRAAYESFNGAATSQPRKVLM